MNAPKASIDQCSNCTYWERITGRATDYSRGVCRIISYPSAFKNDFAFITEIGQSQPAYARARGPQAQDVNGAVVTSDNFFCTLYKVGGAR
jgi:hypothetical protein